MTTSNYQLNICIFLYIQANFVGKSKLLDDWGLWRNQKLVMIDIDLDGSDADPEGNLSVWIAGRVSFQ